MNRLCIPFGLNAQSVPASRSSQSGTPVDDALQLGAQRLCGSDCYIRYLPESCPSHIACNSHGPDGHRQTTPIMERSRNCAYSRKIFFIVYGIPPGADTMQLGQIIFHIYYGVGRIPRKTPLSGQFTDPFSALLGQEDLSCCARKKGDGRTGRRGYPERFPGFGRCGDHHARANPNPQEHRRVDMVTDPIDDGLGESTYLYIVPIGKSQIGDQRAEKKFVGIVSQDERLFPQECVNQAMRGTPAASHPGSQLYGTQPVLRLCNRAQQLEGFVHGRRLVSVWGQIVLFFLHVKFSIVNDYGKTPIEFIVVSKIADMLKKHNKILLYSIKKADTLASMRK
jgi:hypothetical protein